MENNTTTNAVENTPAQLELARIQDKLEIAEKMIADLKLQCRKEIDSINTLLTQKSESIAESVSVLIKQLDGVDIGDIIYELPKQKVIDVVRILTNMNPQYVKDGINSSVNSEHFNAEIDNLDDYISDKYDEGDIIGLIDDKYSWSNLLERAFSRGSIDNSDVVDHIDTEDIVNDYLRGGNMDFSDIMHHFDESDCFSYLSDEGRISWENVKDYVDMDDVKADIEIDNDMVGEYISNLNDSEFRNLITNLS